MDIGTVRLYLAHHITMGEGGAVFTTNGRSKSVMVLFRDCGRDCYGKPGFDNTCNKRLTCQRGELPEGYDHKYIYSHFGYNLKIINTLDSCALVHLDRLESFVQDRKNIFNI